MNVTCTRNGATTTQGATSAPMAITVNGRQLSTRRVHSVMLHLSRHDVDGLDVRIDGGLEADLANDIMVGEWIAAQLAAPPRRTTRERRVARAERLQGWADRNEQKAGDAHAAADRATAGIPLGQPILVGHHSQRRHERALERSHAGIRRAIEHRDRAADQRSRAENITAQAEHAIYGDDVDAIDRLRERIAELEAQRDRFKAYNVTCRKGSTPDLSLLTDAEAADHRRTLAVAAWQCPNGRIPSYAITNLGANIRRYRKRLDALRAREA